MHTCPPSSASLYASRLRAGMARWRPLVCLGLLGLAAAAAPADARPFAPGHALAHPRLVGVLAQWLDAEHRGDARAARRHVAVGQLAFDAAGRVLVQLQLAAPWSADAVPAAWLAEQGGRIEVRGTDLLDAWVPPAALPRLLEAHPAFANAQAPWRPVATVGKVQSEGASRLRTAEVACLGEAATGTTVAVLDSGYAGLTEAEKSGDAPNLLAHPAPGAGPHGTMCIEVIADVAPGASILPVVTGTFANLQKFAKEVTQGGNPHGVDIVSHSAIWMGMSFGRPEGPACAIVEQLRAAGVAWVNASGNSGGGKFHASVFKDADGDGRHEFQTGDERLTFVHHGGPIQIVLDWDDYKARTLDLDLLLEKLDGKTWTLVDESVLPASKALPPTESVQGGPAGGVYGLVVLANTKIPKGLRLRIVHLGGGNAGPFSVWAASGSVYDPGSCPGSLTVGALYHGNYDKGPLEGYSSYGPTVDGRLKPEVVAPTGIKTTMGDFYGTSAACPHAAGLLALHVAATGLPATQLAARLAEDATPLAGIEAPDDAWGYGRIRTIGARLGWGCTSAVQPPQESTCATACGSVGNRLCGATCRWNACQPPGEVCNGLDDDCDGKTDGAGLFNCPSPGATAGADAGADAASLADGDAIDRGGRGVGAATAGIDAGPRADAKAVPVAKPAPPADSGCAAGSQQGGFLVGLCTAAAALWVARRRRSVGRG